MGNWARKKEEEEEEEEEGEKGETENRLKFLSPFSFFLLFLSKQVSSSTQSPVVGSSVV